MIDKEWLYYCMQAGEFLYGFFPEELLKKMYETKKGCFATTDDLMDAADEAQNTLMEFEFGTLPGTDDTYSDSIGYYAPVLVNADTAPKLYEVMTKAKAHGNPFAQLHLDSIAQEELLEKQADVDFYLPTEEEIRSIVDNGYIRTPEMTALEEYLKAHGGKTDWVVPYWQKHLTELDVDRDIFTSVLNECGISFSDLDQVNEFIRCFNDFINSGNIRSRRGYAPNVLHEKEREKYGDQPIRIVPGSQMAAKMLWQGKEQIEAMGAKIDFDESAGRFYTIGPYGERQELKVYPNDPCPCGSGKKYKKCHGRFAK